MGMRVGELVDQVFNEILVGTYAASYNELADACGPDDQVLTLSLVPNGPAKGGLLALFDELCMVVDVSPQQRQVTVIRGVRGTSRAPHSVGTLVEANPRYWRALVRKAAYDELRSWPKRVYRTEAYRTTLARGGLAIHVQNASQLPVWDVLAVRRTSRHITDQRDFGVSYSSAIDVHSDGDCWVYLDCPTPADAAVTVHLATAWNVGGPWDDLVDLAAVGLDDSQVDALVIGTAWRLVTPREIRRLQTEAQGQSRTPQEVPAGATSQLGFRLKLMRDQRLDEEAERLLERKGHL